MKKGGVEVWANQVPNSPEWFGGVEIHSSTPIYEDQQPNEKCRITMGKCYHTGTSLYFQERLKEYFIGIENPATEEWLWEIMWHTAEKFFREEFEKNEKQKNS